MARILVIDDDEQLRRMLCLALGREGYVVVEAGDGNEGLHQLREAPVDLIITDLLMPEKEGLETIMDIRREFPDVKIIAMSGGGQARNLNFLRVAERLGAQRTMSKPFHIHALLAVVQELLQ